MQFHPSYHLAGASLPLDMKYLLITVPVPHSRSSSTAYLNAEFQRIAKRDKKPFFSDQCKEIEENNRMGKTRDLFKKIRGTRMLWI